MSAQSGDNSGIDKRLSLAPTDNKLKRKRGDTDKPLIDFKLQEYLKVMEAPSKSKTWASGDYLQTETPSLAQTEAPTFGKEDEPSDAEYEEGSKRLKKRRADSETRALHTQTPAHEIDQRPPENPTQSEVPSAAANEQVPSDADREGEKDSLAATDTDWLRTRTSRLLGLTDADDHPNTATADPVTLPDLKSQLGPGQSNEPGGPDDSPEENPDFIEADAPLGTVDANVAAIELSGRLFVRNLPYSTGEDELRQIFLTAGQLEEVRLRRNSFLHASFVFLLL